jgi:peptide-methionine (R)-S-oxide reductase
VDIVNRRAFLGTLALGSLAVFVKGLVGGGNLAAAAQAARAANTAGTRKGSDVIEKIHKTNAEWKQVLTKEQYYVLREKGTERAWTGEYAKNHDKGIYHCAACDLDLFDSDTKFESGTGWPSFWQPIAPNRVENVTDKSLFMSRTEVLCARCEGHLGHVFDDGPKPTGLRYCMNSVSLKFKKA